MVWARAGQRHGVRHTGDGRQRPRPAFDRWLEWEHDDHPRYPVDLNFLAHAEACEGREAEAAVLFRRIGRHATRRPWAYPGRDPGRAFRTARAAALRTGGSAPQLRGG